MQLGQERAEIEPVVSRFHVYKRAESDLQSAQQMLSEPEMKALAEEEIDASKARIAALARQRAAREAAGAESTNSEPGVMTHEQREAERLAQRAKDDATNQAAVERLRARGIKVGGDRGRA